MKKFVIVGAGSRGTEMYAVPICKKYADTAELAGVYDINKKRAQLLANRTGKEIPVFDSFEDMLAVMPDYVIVTCIDRFHSKYIIQSLQAGINVITEKPLTISAEECMAIIEAEKKSGKKLIVTFNCRFMPFAEKIKQIIKEGSVGKIFSVHFEWFLDTSHGADYFRRWHRKKENSGGLLIHKASHHFDLVNWFLEEDPEYVSAFGSRRFYGPTRTNRGVRCLNCKYRETCEFFIDISQPQYREMYLDCEGEDYYYRDRCVFSSEIDIEDTVSAIVKYSGGVTMSYSLTAHSPYEGYRMVINGYDGRIEADYIYGAVGAYKGQHINKLKLFDRESHITDFEIYDEGKVHGGGDERLLEMIMNENIPDPFSKMADSRAGVMSSVIGIAANISINEGRMIKISELIY